MVNTTQYHYQPMSGRVPSGGKRRRTRTRKHRVKKAKRKTYMRRRVRPTKKRRVKRKGQRKTKNRRRRQRGGEESFPQDIGEGNSPDKAATQARQNDEEDKKKWKEKWNEYVDGFVNDPFNDRSFRDNTVGEQSSSDRVVVKPSMTGLFNHYYYNFDASAQDAKDLQANLKSEVNKEFENRIKREEQRFDRALDAADKKTGASKTSATSVAAGVMKALNMGKQFSAVKSHNDRHALREKLIEKAESYGENNSENREAAKKYFAFKAAVETENRNGKSVVRGLHPLDKERLIRESVDKLKSERNRRLREEEGQERLVANRTLGDVKENAKADALRRAIEETKKGEAVLDEDVTDGSYKTKTGGRRKKRSTSRTRRRSGSTTKKKLGRKKRSRKA